MNEMWTIDVLARDGAIVEIIQRRVRTSRRGVLATYHGKTYEVGFNGRTYILVENQ